jgi:hypothetical protein
MDEVEEMLITVAVLRLVEPFARRSERLEKRYLHQFFLLPCQIITYPAVTENISEKPRSKKKKKKGRRTVKDALDIDIKYIIPSFLLWKIAERASPSDTRVVHENMNVVFTFAEFRNEGITTRF